jgi:hypothetical protein
MVMTGPTRSVPSVGGRRAAGQVVGERRASEVMNIHKNQTLLFVWKYQSNVRICQARPPRLGESNGPTSTPTPMKIAQIQMTCGVK